MGSNKLNLAILISGRGSNMQALIEACEDEFFPARVGVVFSNNPEAEGLKIAKNKGIKTEILNHKNFPVCIGWKH